jgi:hypothetical protein
VRQGRCIDLDLAGREHKRLVPWFFVDSLNRSAALLESSVSVSCNIARQVMGHASMDEYIYTCCRPWPLEAALNSYLPCPALRSANFERIVAQFGND